ncbi:MAG TPA: nitroreductase/quinone reductase family protein [Acidimicrobiia bacterium]|nr:nitroreductase/quinone reductase family protein [Acidimicrobiia bacterium]
MSLSAEHLDLVTRANEVLIETRSGARVFQTVIWVVVDGDDVLVRSVRGESGRWYQRALANPEVALIVGDTRLELMAVPASDEVAVERASEALRRKYRVGRSLDAMLVPEVLGTTLLLEPVA